MGGSGDANPGLLARLVRNTAALFEPVAAPAAPRPAEKYLLLAVLLLAAIVRFWELGSFSLHKSDEDTTVLAAAHILEDGTPRFPSGMFYARAIVQSYLIAGAFMAFGETEWSARLPSALCGILVVWLGWLVARRFLTGPWRIAFALSLALLPMLIADSQEARMYIFMVAALLAAMWQTFLWEHGWAPRHLVFAVLWMLVAIQFQSLALLGAAVLLFPGLVAGDLRRTRRRSISRAGWIRSWSARSRPQACCRLPRRWCWSRSAGRWWCAPRAAPASRAGRWWRSWRWPFCTRGCCTITWRRWPGSARW
jgi:predicted membrane-bound mannosyltransferase